MKDVKVKERLQDILSDFISKDAKTIDMLKNNSKTIGGVLGMENAIHKDMQGSNDLPEEFSTKEKIQTCKI